MSFSTKGRDRGEKLIKYFDENT